MDGENTNPQQQNQAQAPVDKDAEENKLSAVLAYLFILCIVPLVLKKESPFAKFHGKQGLILCIAWFFTWVPFVGWILGIFLAVLSVLGIINALNGKKEKLPLIGEFADKLNI